ncbi:lytic murein transglycosylase [Patescibacteria group bacterium]|nr:lytic murein transglycosylase [Patescibacteria group bacterium]
MAFRALFGGFLIVLVFVTSGIFVAPTSAQELSESEREELEEEYDKLQEEIAQWEKILAETRAQKGTLQGDVTALNAQIREAEAQIKAKNNAISRLGGEIKQRNTRIGELETKIGSGQQSLAAMLRRQNQVDDLTLFEIALATENAFSLFEDVDNMISVQIGLHEEFAELRGVKAETEAEREALAARQDAELDARYVVETKKAQVAKDEAEKQRLLAIKANEEAAYNQVLVERQAQAAAIRARLFPLRDTEGIEFGDAVAYAQQASAKTGVRPALILAILSQESALGTNVGNCYVTDLTTGDGKGKNTGTPFLGVMKVPRDTVPFERITTALGKDWSTTPVSCPQPGGYGGAMGPTQFIPSTWEMFEGRLKTALGVSATNPWNAGHAIMATGIYLADVGASAGGYSAEHRAAATYYAGSGWATRGQTYANSVMAKATKFQEDIDFLADN